MTTIAASIGDKEHPASIACDLQFTYKGTQKFKGSTKILSLEGSVPQNIFGVDKAFIGFSGNADVWGEIVNWFTLQDGDPPRCKNIEFLMLTSKNQLFHGTNLRNWMLIPAKHFSIGSGCDFAMGAMTAGKTPQEAVLVASKHDISTGMGSKVYSF